MPKDSRTVSQKPAIQKIYILGDSLSDRGTLWKRKILGLVPMRALSGLTHKSSKGRFTNGYVWADNFAAALINHWVLDLLRPLYLDDSQLADGLLTHNPKNNETLAETYHLHSQTTVQYKNSDFVRTYTEGGLTAANYWGHLSPNPRLLFIRLLLSQLKEKRKKLMKEAAKEPHTEEELKQTLIIEWSGGNDLVTVNNHPSHQTADRAIAARMANIETMIEAGYRHFLLMNIPDLALSPKFQKKSAAEQEKAKEISSYFNSQLALKTRELQAKHPDCRIDLFRVDKIFKSIYQNPGKYHFDPDKLSIPYTQSKDFNLAEDKQSTSNGYLFWDGLHPTAHLHQILADRIYQFFAKHYQLVLPDLPEEQAAVKQNKSPNPNQFFKTPPKAPPPPPSLSKATSGPHRPPLRRTASAEFHPR